MTAALSDGHAIEQSDGPSPVHSSVSMGDFLFVPASAPASGINGTLHGHGMVVSLTWSAPALQELAATMEDLENAFLDGWRGAGLPGGADGGRAGFHKHA
ncbi:hypothetical protein GCM10010274_09410 [Streptomyces lavendofoliae]|uniref:Uncharacterized protein n=2 Tax=Streptomyces lavendofoliae TaxID=67314 RepID=A0A918HUE2_9ACTN|nr:hypothetical protein GCM10010274_09410 [Streptomyces lavendofoliae]